MSWQVANIEELRGDRPEAYIRRHFDIAAFGVNAWTPREDGTIIPEHDEMSSGEEEFYLVLSGTATFALGEETVEAPTGTAIHVEPAVTRSATGPAGTTILAVGATRGEAYRPTGWEIGAPALPLFASGDYAGAKEILLGGLAAFPESPMMLYNLACAEARLGEREAALTHVARAAELDARFAGYAQTDEDLESIRDDAAFPAAVPA